jgi:hypothetical protein
MKPIFVLRSQHPYAAGGAGEEGGGDARPVQRERDAAAGDAARGPRGRGGIRGQVLRALLHGAARGGGGQVGLYTLKLYTFNPVITFVHVGAAHV